MKTEIIIAVFAVCIFARNAKGDAIGVSHSDSPEMKAQRSLCLECLNANGQKERAQSEITHIRPITGWSDPDWGVYNSGLHTSLDDSRTITFRSWFGKNQTVQIHIKTEHDIIGAATGKHAEFELKDDSGHDIKTPDGNNPTTIDFIGWGNVKCRARVYLASGDDNLAVLFDITSDLH